MREAPRFRPGRYSREYTPTPPKAEPFVPATPIPDRNGRLSLAIRVQWQCPCGAVKSGAFCKDCGRCFQHEVPVNGCSCPLEAE
jgi:hypothetical protein